MYQQKYKKYKLKYLELKQGGGYNINELMNSIKPLLDHDTFVLLSSQMIQIPDDFLPNRRYEIAYNKILEKATELKNQKLIDFLKTIKKQI
jgi:ribosomal protein S7